MAIIELINKVWDLIKSLVTKKTEKQSERKKKERSRPTPPKLIRLRDYFNANDRKNLADWAKQEGLSLMKNIRGELVIIEKQAFFLWKNSKRGSMQGKKRLKIAKTLEQIFQFYP